MQAINNCARLIVINYKNEAYRLLPAGDAVEMPDSAKAESKFLQQMIKDGNVRIVTAFPNDPLADLREDAKALGVDGVTKNWGEAKLLAAIEEAKSGKD